MTSRILAFVGSLNREAPYFQGARGTGIAAFAFDPETGRLAPLGETAGIDNPTYLTVDPGRRCLYANSEVFGWNEGTVTAYRIDPATGGLTYLSKQPTLGSITAYNSLDRSGRWLLVANYAIGKPGDLPGQGVAVFPIREDGGLGPAVASQAHQGSGPVADRQEMPHAHCIVASPDNRFVVVADLGIDALVTYRFAAGAGQLSHASRTALPPGSGPRHLVFHPAGRFAYVINELASTIAALAYDPERGAFEQLQTVPAVPEEARAGNHCADLHITPDGRFLYGSNRGHDSIVIHAVDAATGRLTLVGHQPSGGRTPRNFAIDPTGRFLVAANQNSDNLVVFRIDPATGRLADTGERTEVGTPMCVKLATF